VWQRLLVLVADVLQQVGVQELWLVDTPASTVIVYRRTTPESSGFDDDAEFGPGTTLVSPLLDGFELTVDELFGD